MTTPKDNRPLLEAFQQVWSQALIAVVGAEDEAAKLLGRLQGSAGWSPEDVKRQAREFSERLATQRRDFERRLDETAKTAVARLKVPRREEVAQLNARLDTLARRIEGLSK